MAKNKGKEGEETSTKSSNGKGMMIVLFVLGLIVLGGAAFGGTYLFFKTMNNTPATEEQEEVIIEQSYIDLEEFTINLGDTSGKKYFKGELSLGYEKKDTDTETEITENVVVIRDVIIFYFKGKEASYINDVNNKDMIKEELIEAINKELVKGKITDVRFKNMLVQ